MASCEITRLLASFLDSTTDRLAVLCTMPADVKQETYNPVILTPLSRINPRKLKATLDSVASSIVNPGKSILIEAIKQAQQVLLKSTHSPLLGEPIHETFGHVVVLTADARGLCGVNLGSRTLQTHILCTGIPKEGIWNKIESNGWKMCLMSAFVAKDRPHHSRSKKDIDPQSLNNRLLALVQHARSGRLAAFLTDVVLDIESGSGCRREKTMGWSSYSKLQIGEVKTVLVSLLHEGSITEPTYLDNPCWHDFNAPSNGDKLMEEIDRLLGFPEEGVLTAKLRYQQSSLPKHTTCVTTTNCLLRLQLPTPKANKVVGKPLPSKGTRLVHQRLAEYFAAYYKPRDALSALQQEFGEEGCRSACPVYINALVDELKYQARILERIAIEHSPQKPTNQSKKPGPGAAVDCSRPLSFSQENYKPCHRTKIPGKESLMPSESQIRLVEQLGLDDAWRIWSDLRHMVGGENAENRRMLSTSLALKERAARISEAALKNKKSIGGSTVRSFSSPLQRSTKSNVVAPWL